MRLTAAHIRAALSINFSLMGASGREAATSSQSSAGFSGEKYYYICSLLLCIYVFKALLHYFVK